MDINGKVIAGALSAAATVLLGYWAYRNVGGGPSSTRTRNQQRRNRLGEGSSADVSGDDGEGRKTSLMEMEAMQKLLKRAFRATHAKDMVLCVDVLDEIIQKYDGGFDAYLLRARCGLFAKEFCRGKPSEEEEVKRILKRVEHLDREADLRMAKKMASNEAQHVIVDVETRVGHLQEEDLTMEMLEESIAALNAVIDADEKWAQYDMLLLERINLYVGCITQLNQQVNETDKPVSEDDQQKIQDRMVEYIMKVTRDCDKIVECSKNEETLADAYYYRANFMEMGSPDQLICISKSISKLPDFVDALALRAQIYFSAFEDIPHALSDFERVLKLEPSNTDALFYKAACLLRQGVTKKPTTPVSEADNTRSDATSDETSEASTAVSPTETANTASKEASVSANEVLELLERVLQLQPDHFDAAATLCNLLQDCGEVHKAPDIIRTQIELLGSKIPLMTLLDLHLLLAEYLLSAQQFDECARICMEQAKHIERMEPSDADVQRIEQTLKNFKSLQRFAVSVRDNMSLFPTLDAKFAGERAPFMENMVRKELRELVLTEEEETEEKTLGRFIDCFVYLFVAGTARVSMYQGLERFKELISQEGKNGVLKACRNGFFLTQFISDYVMRGEAGQCFVCDPNFVNTLEQMLQAEKDGKNEFYESLDQFFMQILMIAEQRRRQHQMIQQQQLLAAMQQQQQQQQQ